MKKKGWYMFDNAPSYKGLLKKFAFCLEQTHSRIFMLQL
jgi:hypothetical protein